MMHVVADAVLEQRGSNVLRIPIGIIRGIQEYEDVNVKCDLVVLLLLLLRML